MPKTNENHRCNYSADGLLLDSYNDFCLAIAYTIFYKNIKF